MGKTISLGSAGARRASALLGIAACAETSHATMDEDCAKVDLKLSFRHAFEEEKLLTLHAQVKTGGSYRANSSDENHIVLQNIDPDTMHALSAPNAPGIIIWVPPKPMNRIYWHARDPRNTLKMPIRVDRRNYIRPSIRYDLTRLCEYSSYANKSPMQNVKSEQNDNILDLARDSYSNLMKSTWKNPLVGKLEVTNLAWRHITRRSKATALRVASLKVIPYLRVFLEKLPDRYVCNLHDIKEVGRKTVEERILLCWYSRALRIDGKPHSLLIRIKEEITYPTKWDASILELSDIQQKATLASWWSKAER